uniref:restriction endonuclease subunit S n=1 Tax=Bacteroides fragilis TaxID=817 RepID=UPI0035693628
MSSYYEKILATREVKCIDEEIPFEIPQGWEWTRIGNIFNHTSGKQQSSSNKGGGTPQKFITTSNLYWGHFILDNVKVMNFTDEEIKTCSATKGDLLVCEGGAGYGRSAIWNEDYDICLQNHVHRLRPCVSGICEYVYHFIYLLKESNNLASVGTAMPGLSANRLKGLLLPFPPLSEQRRIVAKLAELLPQTEKYNNVQNKLDELNTTIKDCLKKSILQEAIQGKLVPQLAEEGTAQELLEQIKTEKQKLVKEGKLKKSALKDSVIFKGDDNKYYEQIGKKCLDITELIPFEIPNSWTWARMGQIGDWGAGSTPQRSNQDYYGGNILWLKTGELNNSVICDTEERITQRAFQECSLRMNKIGDVLIAMYGATIGKLAIVGKELTTNQACCGCTPYVVYNWFLFYFLMASRDTFIKKGEGGAQPNISRVKLVEHLIPLPPLNEQKRIVERIETLFEQL